MTSTPISCAGLQRLIAGFAICLLLIASPASAFQLQSLKADRVNLNDYVGDGRWTLVMFWSTDCIPCEEQKPMIESFHQQHHKIDARVVGIALDGMENYAGIKKLVDHHNPSYPNLVIFTDVFHRQYKELTGKDFRATPTYLLFSPDGQLSGSKAGKIERSLLESVVSQNQK
ncbi:MAG: thiol-disulfide isomerase/thioredoxin [Granulosicoccus sp.]|jgi:thiol-disulfide isomerase/thioredoxin